MSFLKFARKHLIAGLCVAALCCVGIVEAQDDEWEPPAPEELAPEELVAPTFEDEAAPDQGQAAPPAPTVEPEAPATPPANGQDAPTPSDLLPEPDREGAPAPAPADAREEPGSPPVKDEPVPDEDKPVFEPERQMAPPPLQPESSFSPEPLEPAALPSGAPASARFDEELKPEDMAAIQKQVRLQADEVQGIQLYDKAAYAKASGNYAEAIKFFTQALEYLPKRPQNIDLHQNIRAALAETYYLMAESSFAEGNLDDARKHVAQTLGVDSGHQKAMALNSRIQRQEDKAKQVVERPVSVGLQDEFRRKEERIDDAMKLGRQYVSIGEYDKAKIEFKKILLEDPENTSARAQLRLISEYEYDVYRKAERTVIAERMAEVKERWSTPSSRDRIDRAALPRPDQQPEAARTGRASRLSEKLNQIKIKEINFRDANIVDVVDFLIKASREGDLGSPPAERGINIVLNFRRPGEAGGASPMPAQPTPIVEETSFFDDEESAMPSAMPPAMASPEMSVPRITLSLQNVVLLDALRYITEITGLKYRIEDSAVVITPADVVYGQVVSRVYTVQPSLIEMTRSESGGGGGAGFDDFGATASTGEAKHEVKEFFVKAGVPFPEGTSIIYKPSMNKMIVNNTPDNLEQFERILAELNVVPSQVEIEARFVEIGQRDLEEIGMEWLLTDNWQIAENASAGSSLLPGARERIQINRTDFTKGLRFLNTSSSVEGNTAGRSSLGNLLSVSSILTNPELSFVLHALEQRTGANLLSAPKVTTKSGQSAEIKVVQEIRYPTDWEQNAQEASTGGGSGSSQSTRVVVTPTDFETEEVGVILSATPMVGPDGYTIDLTMIPMVVEISDWIDYGQDIFDDVGNLVAHQAMTQPVFHKRTIATSISIWDGETVVMGGLITESKTTVEDKIPLLGDIPLVGYLFRSKSSVSVKRNLLIFVTARLVDPAGRVIRKSEDPSAIIAGMSSVSP